MGPSLKYVACPWSREWRDKEDFKSALLSSEFIRFLFFTRKWREHVLWFKEKCLDFSNIGWLQSRGQLLCIFGALFLLVLGFLLKYKVPGKHIFEISERTGWEINNGRKFALYAKTFTKPFQFPGIVQSRQELLLVVPLKIWARIDWSLVDSHSILTSLKKGVFVWMSI